VPERAETHVGHAWLPAVLPASSRRLLVSDPVLAEVLLDAGAELVERGADVEIGPPSRLAGDAPLAAAPIGDPNPDARSFAGRVGSRARSTALVRIESVRARRGLRRLGYRQTEVFAWDLGHPLALGEHGGRSVAERLPRRAVVVARHGTREPTLLEGAVEDAAGAVGRPLRLEWASARAGPTTAALDGGLLRIAVGPSRGQLERQAAAHATLREAQLPREVAALIPWVEEQGRTGLADWSLEQRLPGGSPQPNFSDRLLADCVDFLVTLHGAGKTAEPPRLAGATAETAAGFLPQAEARTIVSLGERLDATLANVPRGFAHGDFFRGNMLVENGGLVGVVDWDASGPGRLPLLDLLHLRHMNEHRPADLDWGPTLVEHLLPWARAGGDEPARDYCRRIGIDPLPERLEGLVAAYWLDRLAYQLSTYADRAVRPRWLERNVAHVLQALAPRLRA
jgi:Phosphotransferase enzyme family